ncbi:MAG: helix-turn-helix domain-containing protein [Clostridiales bacterium]|nr:helix-turn-helix domain-containing protein [Clostridiales bacterium]
MELRLGENIKKMRKDRALTQEGLADALGVTTGAVYKWESGLSVPELTMLVKLADYFEVSVDVLLGYKKLDGRREEIAQQIYRYIGAKDRSGIDEAERALLKYPNDYGIIKAAANIWASFGIEEKDHEMMRRSIMLFEKALTLIPNDEDPRYGELAIYGSIATIYYTLGERERAVSILKKNNKGGIFNTEIGSMMSLDHARSAECRNYLMNGFIQVNSRLINMAFGLNCFYKEQGDMTMVREVSEWILNYIESIRGSADICYADKIGSAYLVCLSYAVYRLEGEDQGREYLIKAKSLAERFDSSPDYRLPSRFFGGAEQGSSYDILGRTASESIETALDFIKDKKFTALWNKVNA